jgi:peptidyl-dipeptidase Dcp
VTSAAEQGTRRDRAGLPAPEPFVKIPERENPLFAPSTLSFGAPPFDQIRDTDYQPAIERGMREQLAEVAAIANQADAPTFENTIVALERSGALFTRVLKIFGTVAAANTNDTLQEAQRVLAPRLAAHTDAIYLDNALYQRVRELYERRENLGLSGEAKHLLERYHLDFIRAGAGLSDAGKAQLRALNQEEATLTTEFQTRLLAATKDGGLVIDDRSDLEGLSDADIAAAAEAAAERGLSGKWLLRLQNTTQQPALESLRNRAVRQRLFEASLHRADRAGDNDTRAIVQRLSKLRAERADLLGYPTAAAYALDDQMAKTPEAATALLTDVAKVATTKARREAAKIQALMDRDHGGIPLEPWDWQYYAAKVREAEFDIDESQLKPYLELDRVLRDGVFSAANQLFGLTFDERRDLPTYHSDVRVFEVRDEDGSAIGLLYTDYFKRDNKNGGAWMDSFTDQSALLGTKPVIVNAANFTKPAAGQPALLSFDDATTLFHEFGHGLHGLLSRVEYPMLTGTNVPRDFVEFPSQFNEHCALDPNVLRCYARHHETGEPMPQELVDKIKKSRIFNQGFALTEYLAAALLDMAWHTRSADQPPPSVEEFEVEALRQHQVEVREVPPRYRTTYFAHIWDGGYHASYYAYLWAEVLDHDTFAWFTERGGLTRENGQRLREMILSRGGTDDADALYREFRGRVPSIGPLLFHRGLTSDQGEGEDIMSIVE